MSKPIIAITSRYQDRHVWQRPGYLDCIDAAGGVPVCLSVHGGQTGIQALVDRFDGFILSGGDDIHPGVYGEDMHESCQVDSDRDAFEIPLMHAILNSGKPFLGICRGMQVLNVALGGTLYQDIPTQLPQSQLMHKQEEPFDRKVHPVNIIRNTPLNKLFGTERIEINSMHHQAIHKLADPLRSTAIADDRVIEAVYLPDHPFTIAVQWHPEWLGMDDPFSAKLFLAFVDACQK